MSKELQTLDIGEQEAMTKIIILMLQKCPALSSGITTKVEDLMTTPNVIGVFPLQGSVYLKKYISGAFVGQHPFMIRYRTMPTDDEAKVNAAEMLDKVGRWLEGQAISVDGQEYQLAAYPEMTDGRKILSIERQSNAFLSVLLDDGTADYQINMRVKYGKA